MTGKIITGEEADKLGLVTACYDDPMEYTKTLCQELIKRSPDALAAAKHLYQKTWGSPEDACLQVETELQEKLLISFNQMAASGRAFGWEVPYVKRK
jgi:enoyl-CoA hydratase/carnithine racemase